MSLTIPNPDFIPSTTIASVEVDADFAAVVAKFSKGINDTDITDASLTDVLMAAAASVQNYFASYTTAQPNGYTESGGQGASDAGSLTHTISALIAYPKKTSVSPAKLVRVTKIATSHTYTANRDTYVDINSSGNFVFIELSNGAGTPAVSADSTRLMKVVSGASSITVTDQRTLISAVSATAPRNYKVGLGPVYKTATTAAVSAGAIEYGGQLLLQTGESSAVDVTNNANFVSGTAAINQWQWLVGADNGAGGISPKYATSSPNASDYSGTSGTAGYDALWRSFSGTMYRYFGAVLTDGSGNIKAFRKIGNRVIWADYVALLSGGASTSYAAVSAVTAAPPTARLLLLHLGVHGATGDNFLRETGFTGNGNRYIVVSNANCSHQIDVPCSAAQSFDYKLAGGTLDIDGNGYEEVL